MHRGKKPLPFDHLVGARSRTWTSNPIINARPFVVAFRKLLVKIWNINLMRHLVIVG